MTSPHKVELKDIGLDIGLAFAKHFYKTDYLHYGYWTDGLKVEPANVLQAQENYARLLLDHIPEGVSSMLDVGCGSGKFAEQLVERGYEVQAVSPSPHLSGLARDRLGSRVLIHECRFEDLRGKKRYDLILFSESFQYLLLEEAFAQMKRFLKPEGWVLICDFFKRDEAPQNNPPFQPGEKSPISGGHAIGRFLQYVETQPFSLVKERDITAETAPSLDLMRDLMLEVVVPTWNAVAYYARQNYPKFSTAFSWLFRRKIEQAHRKYLSGNTNGEKFNRFKTYRLFLYKHKQES